MPFLRKLSLHILVYHLVFGSADLYICYLSAGANKVGGGSKEDSWHV